MTKHSMGALLAPEYTVMDAANSRTPTLIIVPGHGVAINPLKYLQDDAWVGIYEGEAKLLAQHLITAIQYTAENPYSLLVLSGGRTRETAGPISEAKSYYAIAAANGFFGFPEVAKRTILEEYGRISFDNLLYSICAGCEHTNGHLPQRIVICSWGFKAPRFDWHRKTLGISSSRYQYIEVCNPPDGPALEAALAGEARALAMVKDDPWMHSTPYFRRLKIERNPFGQAHPYGRVNLPELQDLLKFYERDEYVRFPWGYGQSPEINAGGVLLPFK